MCDYCGEINLKCNHTEESRPGYYKSDTGISHSSHIVN